ncbi:hypothetical protein JZ785_12600 [Alicyclobacillus curvatus]|nr:hypothetical protein JZ785_12600 [Alicyclobacillus curvatus]
MASWSQLPVSLLHTCFILSARHGSTIETVHKIPADNQNETATRLDLLSGVTGIIHGVEYSIPPFNLR